jgi:hypothetical protein
LTSKKWSENILVTFPKNVDEKKVGKLPKNVDEKKMLAALPKNVGQIWAMLLKMLTKKC